MTNPSSDAPAETTQFTCYAVFGRRTPLPTAAVEETIALIDRLQTGSVTVRGLYDVTAMPAEANLLVWLHGADPAALQAAVRDFQRVALADTVNLVWTGMGVHRTAEFNRRHAPAYLLGEPAKQWLTVYPFVRSYEWYLLPETERRDLLVEHGRLGREFPQVLSNTVAAFALGDYEWLLGLEADELIDLVDLMRHLRTAGARRHVRVETPFFTGRKIAPDELLTVLR
ncbi:MAG: chlorite dismutase [Actinobacteria bacterium HGW-Actinobacteria-2]|nr:MAG: chlorite dismutase [Actinobacteria bacterium HGW-Actinobacteria-2]